MEEAKRTIKIKTFIAYIDDKRTAYDLKSQIQILVLKGKNDNSDYNGEIHIAPLSEQSNKSDPLSIKNLTENSREKIHEELNIKIGKEDISKHGIRIIVNPVVHHVPLVIRNR